MTGGGEILLLLGSTQLLFSQLVKGISLHNFISVVTDPTPNVKCNAVIK